MLACWHVVHVANPSRVERDLHHDISNQRGVATPWSRAKGQIMMGIAWIVPQLFLKLRTTDHAGPHNGEEVHFAARTISPQSFRTMLSQEWGHVASRVDG